MIPENTAKNPEINTNLEPVINKKVEVEKKGLLEGRSITKETDKHKKK